MSSEEEDLQEPDGQTKTETRTGAEELPPSGRKALRRTKHDNMLAGVAGGLAEYFAIDVLLVRLAFFLLLIPGGVAVPLYVAAWILIPLEGERYSIAERLLNRARGTRDEDGDDDWVWIALAVVGVLAIGSMLDRGPDGWFFWGGGTAFWSLVLIAAGIWLYRQDQKAVEEEDGSPATSPSPASIGSGTPPPPTGTVTTPAPRRPEPKPRPEPSRLGRYTFASVLLAIGVLATVDNWAEAIDLSIGQYAAVALGVVGIGLLVGSLMGRSRGLVLLGLLLLPLTFIRSGPDLPLNAGAGERIYTPATVEQLDDHDLFAGKLNLDLTDMRWEGSARLPAETALEVVLGQINVVVPSDVVVEFDGRAVMGQVSLFNRHSAGVNPGLQEVAGSGDGPRLILDAEVLMGEINVERASTTARQVRQ